MEACISGNPVNYILDNPVRFCVDCNGYRSVEDFYRDKKRDKKGWSGLRTRCKDHEKIRQIKRGWKPVSTNWNDQ